MRINSYIFILILALLSFIGCFSRADAVLYCGNPGSEVGNPSGIINGYWPGNGDANATVSSVTVGASRSGTSSIAIGDLVLIIQMQDADINSTQSANYGDGTGTGSGATVNSSGLYEYVRATSVLGSGAGTLNFTPALTNNYHTRNYVAGSNGQSRWQIVRVPQYSTATATAVTAPSWNGATGGIVAMDVENTLTLSGNPAINVNGLGFRGGAGRQLTGGAGADTDFRTISTINNNAAKGEGIAGLPRYINDTTAYNTGPTAPYNTGFEGYPNGSSARGAPGNAGGGGTDGNPSANDQNSGGGGGSNYGFGGQGGNAWSSNDPSGGRGGAAFSADLAFNRIFLGGGGGAGTTNNGTGDTGTYTDPPGLPCLAGTGGAGACSSGAAGGGIVLIRAGSMTGTGTITARGSDAYNVENDGAGGGGAGGTVVLQTYFDGDATVDVSGGNGGNCWRARDTDTDRHGPGGGGGGGFIAYSPSSGFNVTATYDAGLSGKSSNEDPYGSTSGNGGITTYDLPNVPGIQPGTFCPPAIKAVSLAVDGGVPGAIDIGDTIEYTIVYRNGSSDQITGFNITDPLPSGVTFVAGSLTVTPSGGATGSANGSYNGTGSTLLLASGVTFPTGGIITAKLRATVNAPLCTVVSNQADSVQSGGDDLGLTDNADNTQNEGGLPPGTYLTQSPYGISGTADLTSFTAACPNFSTSTKSWVDLNGGEQQPGDIIRYTITIIESGGGASTVTLTDHIPLNVNTFNVILPLPTGATNSSTAAPSGNNSTGYLDIRNISIPAGGTVTVSFDVTINTGTDGMTINNMATISTPTGTGGTPTAPPVIVTDSFAPITGTKLLYLYDNSSTPTYKLSRTPTPTGATSSRNINRGASAVWSMNPVAAMPITISSDVNPVVPVQLILRDGGNEGRRSITVSLQCSSGGTILTATNDNVTLTDTRTVVTFDLTTTTPWEVTCGTNAYWNLTVANNNVAGTVNDDMRVYAYRAGLTPPSSRIALPATTVINVDSIKFYDDSLANGGAEITSAAPGDVVYIRSVVSDPFGNYDINASNNATTLPTITITNPSGTTVLTATSMTERTGERTTATETFEYGPYTVNDAGNWNMRVDAKEGTEGTVSDFGIRSLPVVSPPPVLTILKSANGKVTAASGEVITYTVQITNTGTGAASTVILKDKLSPYTSFCLDCYSGGAFSSSAGSGLTLLAPEYSSDNGSNWNYPAGSSGFDGNITNWQIQTTGTLPPGNTLILQYQTEVK